jgi:hypothetical protein
LGLETAEGGGPGAFHFAAGSWLRSRPLAYRCQVSGCSLAPTPRCFCPTLSTLVLF